MPRLAARTDAVIGSATVGISDLVASKRAEGADILSLSLGEPDFETPRHVREAAKRALDAGHTHYTPGAGIMPLREAVADYHRTTNGIAAEAKDVLVTPTKMAVMLAVQATVGAGDEAIVPDPGWVSYAPAVHWAGATPVPVALDEHHGLDADAAAEAITPRTRLLILNSPSNPTGGIDKPEAVRAAVDLAADHDLWILSDEIYQELQYDGEHVSPASLDGGFDRTVTVDGLSKSFAMTGWRLGWAVAPEPLRGAMGRLQSHSLTHCTSFAQHGAVAAMTGPRDSVATMRAAFEARRRVMIEGLRALPGVSCAMPSGAFYAFPQFDAMDGDDDAMCRHFIEHGIAGTPGSAFGATGRGHIRFSYAASEPMIEEGLRRLRAGLEAL